MPYYTVEELKGRFADCEAAMTVIREQIGDRNGIAVWFPWDEGKDLPVTFRSVLKESGRLDEYGQKQIPRDINNDYKCPLCYGAGRITMAPPISDPFYPHPAPRITSGSNAGKWPYRYGDPRDRFSLIPGQDPYQDMRDPWWLPPATRCKWSLEIIREREERRTRSAARLAEINKVMKAKRIKCEMVRRAGEVKRQTVAALITALFAIGLTIALF